MGRFRNNEERSPKAEPVSRLTGKVPTSHETLREIAQDIDDSYDSRPAHWPEETDD
jgi:hypothetical protein